MTFAIQGIPHKWSLKQVRSTLQQDIRCQFKPLYFNFESGKFKKTVYIQLLSNKYDPVEVAREINSIPMYRQLQAKAFIPKYVSQAHIAAGKKPKGKAVPKNKRGAGMSDMPPDQIMITTHKEIMTELQAKYTRLYNLSRKTPGNRLLKDIARIIFERLNNIMETNEEASSTCFKLSSYYRKLHPHFGDFQMILSTLHKLQDEHGIPRTELVESDLTAVSSQLYVIDNIPYDKIKSATDKYSVRITKRVLEHVRKLNSEPQQMDTEEDAARKKVRLHLKNMSQHLPSIIRQVIQKHLTPEKAPFHRVRIYGEPFLPSKDLMAPFTRRFKAVHIVRSDRMYNLLKMNIPPSQYSSLMAADGISVVPEDVQHLLTECSRNRAQREALIASAHLNPHDTGVFMQILVNPNSDLARAVYGLADVLLASSAKLVIRSSDVPLYKVPDSLIAEMKAAFGIGHIPSEEDYVPEPHPAIVPVKFGEILM